MAVGDVQPTSFEFYEGIRILVPGALVVGVYQAIVASFDIAAPQPKADALGAIVAALAVGLVLYFIDLPAKTAYALNDQPHQELAEWDVQPPPGTGYLNLYFVLLDQQVPSGIRARALYMGSMYRIGYEAIHLLAFAAVGVLTVAAAAAVNVPSSVPVDGDTRLILIVSAGLQLPVVLGGALFDFRRALNPRYGAVKTGREALRDVSTDLFRHAGKAGVVAIVGAVFVIAHLIWPGLPRGLAVAGISVALAAWTVRYFRGHGDRKPISRSTASAMYGIAVASACLLAGVPEDAAAELTPGLAVGWGAIAILANVLIVSRGHERRLGGSYATQRTWLRMNRPELERTYFPASSTQPGADASETLGADPSIRDGDHKTGQ